MARKRRDRRDDLTCQDCGATFAGHVAIRYCDDCSDKRAAAQEDAEPTTGSEMPVQAEVPSVPPEDPGYRKTVQVDPDRQRYDRRRRDEGDRRAARTRAANALDKESRAERERKGPLREKLAELRRRHDELSGALAGVEQQILRVLDQIGVPAPGDRGARACFGQFDAGDFECTDLCPLRPECEVRAGVAAPLPAGEEVADA